VARPAASPALSDHPHPDPLGSPVRLTHPQSAPGVERGGGVSGVEHHRAPRVGRSDADVAARAGASGAGAGRSPRAPVVCGGVRGAGGRRVGRAGRARPQLAHPRRATTDVSRAGPRAARRCGARPAGVPFGGLGRAVPRAARRGPGTRAAADGAPDGAELRPGGAGDAPRYPGGVGGRVVGLVLASAFAAGTPGGGLLGNRPTNQAP